jgi:ribosome-binding factor A
MARRYSRTQRVSDLIQTTLASILQKESRDVSSMVTVTEVEVSPDFSHAKVYVSVLNEEKAAATVAALNENSKHLRYSLANAIKLRVTPDLKFFYDDSTVRGSHISSLINSALKDK